jgi:Peptidase A4 family
MPSFRHVAVAAVVAVAAAIAAAGSASAALVPGTSSNWAGYVASRDAGTFRSVSGAWTAPAVDCSTGDTRWSAVWVGLGGAHHDSTSLAQVGTEADCEHGAPHYSSWYELVPDASHSAHLTIAPGDQITTSVRAASGGVRMRISNVTRGTTFTKTLPVTGLDRSSAEWIVEAPSSCSGSACRVMPLANFGTTRIADARATSTFGHVGGILDPAWNTLALTLDTAHGHFVGPGDGAVPMDQPVANTIAATPGPIEPTNTAFTVTWTEAG